MKTRSLEKIALPWRMLIALGAGVFFALLLCLAAAWIAFCGANPIARVDVFGSGVYLVTLFVCALLGAKITPENRFFGGLAAGALLWLLLVFGSLFVSGDFLHTALWSGLGFVAIAAGAFLGAKERPRRRRRR